MIPNHFSQTKTIKDIEEYVNAHFHKGDAARKEKVFYHYNEWNGWRFYLKALTHKDWRSLTEHIRSSYFTR